MGLSFLAPLFLVGALAVAVPIVLHLLRRRTETVVEFPAVRLLHSAPIEQQRRRRLRELILLALRITALLLLATAFARPYLTGASLSLTAPVTMVAVDTSMSLSAPGQMDAARAAARRAIAEAPATHTVGVMAFDDAGTVLVAPTTDRGSATTAIDTLASGAGGTRFRTALARAAEVIGRRGGRLVVVTDLQQVGWEASDEGGLPDDVAVEVMEVRPPVGNLAVTHVRRDKGGIVAAIHNFGSRPTRTTARVRVNGRDAGVARVEVAAQSAADVRVPASLPATGAAELAIEDPEGYGPDNTRYLVLDPPSPVPVTILTADPAGTRGGLYVERALASEEGHGFRVEVVDGRAFSTWSDSRVREQAAIVVLGTRTLERAGRDRVREYIGQGGHVLLTLGPDIDVDAVDDLVGEDLGILPDPVTIDDKRATLVASDARHPIFRPFLSPSGALGDVHIERYRRLTDQEGRVVLARFSGGAPALAEQTVGQGRLLVFTSDLDNGWNRFPLNASFVPFALETVRYLTRGRSAREAWVLPEVPPGVPSRPGIVEVLLADGMPEQHRRVAINVDVRESNPTRSTPDEFASNVPRVQPADGPTVTAEARERENEQKLWQVGLLVMFVALAGEGLIGRKAI
jgi:Aerotolerance regulator N-terminal/von Willebrand factor type A domain